jgi:hypothetical protein
MRLICSKGNAHAVAHHQKTGHPLVLKLGTITPEGALFPSCLAIFRLLSLAVVGSIPGERVVFLASMADLCCCNLAAQRLPARLPAAP